MNECSVGPEAADKLEVVSAKRSNWKRWLDVLSIAVSMPVLLPLMAAVAVGIKSVSPGRVFFRHRRIGHMGKPFTCWKFRTMRTDSDPGIHQDHLDRLIRSDQPMMKIDRIGDPRLIPLGALIRAAGLDELPQLINVMLGEMSLVGPRPCLPYEYEMYQPWQKQRFDSLPGLTGLWQVSGKNSTTFSEMIRLDIQYSRTKSLWLDLKIMLKTVAALLGQLRETQVASKPEVVSANWEPVPQ